MSSLPRDVALQCIITDIVSPQLACNFDGRSDAGGFFFLSSAAGAIQCFIPSLEFEMLVIAHLSAI